MTREQRMRSAGMLFYLVITITLILTDSGSLLVRNVISQLELIQVIIAITSIGVAIFTSEPVGFLFGSIPYMMWSLKGGFKPENGGYAAEMRKLTHNIKLDIIQGYKSVYKNENDKSQKPDKKWMKYAPDVFLNYYWQQAPHFIVEWVSRRQSAYFANMSVAVSIGMATILSTIIIFIYQLGWTSSAIAAVVITSLLSLFFLHVAQGARTEAWQMVDVWMEQGFDKQLGKVMQNISDTLKVKGN